MIRFVSATALLLAFSLPTFAQQTAPAKSPTRVEDGHVTARPEFLKFNQLAPATKTSVQAEAALGAAAAVTISSVPHWSSSFTYSGKTYPYTMVGSSPKSNTTVTVPTAILPLSFVFSAYKDANGNPIVLSAKNVLTKVKNSPNWIAAPYSSGHTQFGDAIQRAEFHSTMGANWHTLIASPRILATRTITVPAKYAKVYKTTSGVVYAEVDADYYEVALSKILDKVDFRPGELTMALSRNVLLYQNGDMSQCCILGFHTAFQSGGTSTNPVVQTFGWATWADKGIFKNTDIADVMPLSHEIVEWLDDPFVNNTVPVWKYPDGSACQDNLETGDPVEVLDNMSIPVTINGFSYHPQTEALLQWFSRQSPSSAIYGAYSYPDLSALRTHSSPCK